MKISRIIQRVLLSGAIVASVLVPSSTATAVAAAYSMESMGHAEIDIATCLERHQTPAAPIDRGPKREDVVDEDEPALPEQPYFVVFQKKIPVSNEMASSLVKSPSFVPPDIVILTSQLRI